ncbi:MAG: DUF3039 domain-containing protein [Varibaculum sp.]|nr:DUF3039 domain-containing protein [Varibaculum sp.]
MSQETQSGTGVLERPETKRTPGDNERYAHYVRKSKITQSTVTGQPVVALCGKVWVPLRDPSGYPVCPKCREILSQMRSHSANWPFLEP